MSLSGSWCDGGKITYLKHVKVQLSGQITAEITFLTIFYMDVIDFPVTHKLFVMWLFFQIRHDHFLADWSLLR